MLRVLARNDTAIIVADGQAAAAVRSDGTFVVAPLGSLAVQSDWEAAEGAVPDYVPEEAKQQIAALKREMTP